MFASILKKVIIVSSELLEIYREEAYNIVKSIDVNDTLFIACALAYDGSIIWSNDAKLKNQTKIFIINTKEAIELF